MDKFTCFLCVIVVSCGLVAGQADKAQRVEVNVPRQVLNVGSGASFTCTTFNHDIFGETLAIYKVGLKNPNRIDQITSFNSVEDKYKPNYEIKLDNSRMSADKGGIILFTLSINVLEEKNDGYYKCVIQKSSGERITEIKTEIVVNIPVKKVSLQVGTYQTDDSNKDNAVRLNAKFSPLPVTCTVTGGNPKPIVQLMIDGENILTSALLAESPANINYIVRGSDFNGIRSWTYVFRSSKVLKKEHIGKSIACVGSTPGSNGKPREAKMALVVNEIADIKCKNQETSSASNITVRCEITHNLEAVHADKVRWIEDNTQQEITPNSTSGYRTRVEKTEDKMKIIAILEISTLPGKDNVYQIEVDHLGQKAVQIARVKLEPEPNNKYTRGTGAASSLTPLLTLLTALSLLAIKSS